MHAAVIALAFVMSIGETSLSQGPPPPGPLPPPGRMATSSSTQPVSPAALMTWATRYGHDEVHTLDLIVIWKGSPDWYMRSGPRGGSSGGSRDAFHATIRYGGLELQLGLESSKRIATVQGNPIELGDANVILVDDVDGPQGPQIAGKLRIDPPVPSVDGNAHVVEILRRSQEIVSFLGCDATSVDVWCTQVLGKR